MSHDMKHISAIMLFCYVGVLAACSRTPAEREEELIDEFSDRLGKIILKGDLPSYEQLWLSKDDRAFNIATNKALEIPLRTEGLVTMKKTSAESLQSALTEIKRQLGNPRDVDVLKVDYLIDNHPWKRSDGIFEFAIKITFTAHDKRLIISQRACILTDHGVRIGDVLVVGK